MGIDVGLRMHRVVWPGLLYNRKEPLEIHNPKIKLDILYALHCPLDELRDLIRESHKRRSYKQPHGIDENFAYYCVLLAILFLRFPAYLNNTIGNRKMGQVLLKGVPSLF